MPFTQKHLASLVQISLQNNASDIHIREGEPPTLRIRGELVAVQTKSFERQDIIDICGHLFDDKKKLEHLNEIKEYDGGHSLEGLCRVRYNFFMFNEKLGLILRLVKNDIPSIDALKLPQVLKDIAMQKRGLILVTGPTGSGKSTTLASMVNHINQTRGVHILTIEDPIEYIHPQLKARITQREVGKDTESFRAGLRAALRQDPDIILIGEMRDPETVDIALKAAETGHLVMSTMHTTNAVTTIGRILSLFPADEHEDIRKRLSENLYGTIGQRMLKQARGKGIVLAMEIMVTSPGVRECILGKEPLSRLQRIIDEGSRTKEGINQSFDHHVMELFNQGMITKETAMEAVESQADFMQKLLVD
jgi:twitching motility protein PilT